MSSKSVVVSAVVKFGSASYDVRAIPCGIPESADLPDVTVLADVEQRFEPAACTEDGDIVVTIAGTPPAVNSVGSLVIEKKVSTAGGAAASASVSIGTAIVTSVEPSTLEAGGDRVQTWDVTFKPNGSRT